VSEGKVFKEAGTGACFINAVIIGVLTVLLRAY
jgi:hypothetical protein